MPSSSECGQLAKSGAQIGLMTTCCPSDQFCHSFDYCPNVAIGFLSLGKVQNFHRQVFALSGSILKSSKPMLYIKVYIGMKEGEYDESVEPGEELDIWTMMYQRIRVGQCIRESESDIVSEDRRTRLDNSQQSAAVGGMLAVSGNHKGDQAQKQRLVTLALETQACHLANWCDFDYELKQCGDCQQVVTCSQQCIFTGAAWQWSQSERESNCTLNFAQLKNCIFAQLHICTIAHLCN